jgi:hypothetical protein
MTTHIKSISSLIERLEELQGDLDPRHMTARQYDEVGWAQRAVVALLEQAREEAEQHDWNRRHTESHARVLPKAPRRADTVAASRAAGLRGARA